MLQLLPLRIKHGTFYRELKCLGSRWFEITELGEEIVILFSRANKEEDKQGKLGNLSKKKKKGSSLIVLCRFAVHSYNTMIEPKINKPITFPTMEVDAVSVVFKT